MVVPVKVVETIIATDAAGRVVDAIPVRNADGDNTNEVGKPADAFTATEDELGMPVRFVEGKVALNSAGKPVSVVLIEGVSSVAPEEDWRVAVTDAYDSAGDAALRTALIGSETTKARPGFTMAAATPRTVALELGTVAAPGAILTWVGNTGNYTVAAAISSDSTDGSDGNWTDLGATLVYPAGGGSSVGYADKRQFVEIPAGAAGRWVQIGRAHV